VRWPAGIVDVSVAHVGDGCAQEEANRIEREKDSAQHFHLLLVFVEPLVGESGSANGLGSSVMGDVKRYICRRVSLEPRNVSETRRGGSAAGPADRLLQGSCHG
jgi:hypothetical protein